jgi:hypothetical protein
MHTVGERWYEPHRGEPDWQSFPGKVFLSGTHLLPHPSKCTLIQVEAAIGSTPIAVPPGARDGHPTQGLLVHGVMFAGYRDLVAMATPEEAVRLGVTDLEPVLYDYKSSADIERYALTADQLRDDVQANLYALDVSNTFYTPEVPARWVYFATKKARRAKAVDALIHRDHALEVLEPCALLARELDTYTQPADAPCNTGACNDYNRLCEHHKDSGGPCDARRPSTGSLIQARVKKEIKMDAAEMKAKFDALKKKNAAPAQAEEEAPEAPEEEAPEAEAPAEEEKPAPKAKPAVAPKPAPKAKASKEPTVAELASKLEAAEAHVAEIKAAIVAKLTA